MEFSDELKCRIKDNALHIITEMKKKPRNYLNKQLQDAICNYFLENYAAPYLKEDYKVKCGRKLRRVIEKTLPLVGKKYMNLLNAFKSEILRVGKGEQYRALLSSFVSEENKLPFQSIEWCCLSRKQMVSLLLIVHWDEEKILNFYDMWNKLFPNDPLIQEKKQEQKRKKRSEQKLHNIKMLTSPESFESQGNTIIDKTTKKICSESVNERINSKKISKKERKDNYQQFYGKYCQENQSYFYHLKSSFREIEKVQVDRIANLMIATDLDNPSESPLYQNKNNQISDNFQSKIRCHNFSEFIEENTQSEVEENSYSFNQLHLLQDNIIQNEYFLCHEYFNYEMNNENRRLQENI